MYLNRWGKAFGFVSSMLTDFAACRKCLSMCPLWIANAAHAVRKWLTVSSALLHIGHTGESFLPILFRCACSGTCPVHSWMSRDPFHRSRPCVSLLNLDDGIDGSIALNLWHLGESSNCSFVLMLIHFLWHWRAADLLIGILPLHITGSLPRSLDSPLAARFASPSALSLPRIPSCPGVHLTLISMPGCLFCTAAACS